jgi:hypothetical protein
MVVAGDVRSLGGGVTKWRASIEIRARARWRRKFKIPLHRAL